LVDPKNQFYNDAVSKIDYINIGGWLINGNGLDFTYIHPDVLDERCAVAGNRLELKNSVNSESYKMLILPSCSIISLSNLRKVCDFYNSGGMVLFTTRLPHKSSEPGRDQEVDSLIRSIFPGFEDSAWSIIENKKGGKACYLPDTDAINLAEILYSAGMEYDVSYPLNSDIQYIHKVIDGRNVYFFANTGDSNIQTEVTLRGKMSMEKWDPHTGIVEKASSRSMKNDAIDLFQTMVRLHLAPYHSCFLVETTNE
jgi:hypothetical protein